MSATLSSEFLKLFIETTSAEIGRGNLPFVLEKANLSPDLAGLDAVTRLTPQAAAESYAALQHALRVYYGRGARGALLRVGRNLWNRLAANAGLVEKAHAQFIRSLPLSLRRKSALDLAVRHLSAAGGEVSAYTLDLEFYVQDRNAAAAFRQDDPMPICFVTVGFLEECLYWATGREHDVQEVSYRAAGGQHCEFKIATLAGG